MVHFKTLKLEQLATCLCSIYLFITSPALRRDGPAASILHQSDEFFSVSTSSSPAHSFKLSFSILEIYFPVSCCPPTAGLVEHSLVPVVNQARTQETSSNLLSQASFLICVSHSLSLPALSGQNGNSFIFFPVKNRQKCTFTQCCWLFFFFKSEIFLIFFPVQQGEKDEMTGELTQTRPESDIQI